MSEREYIVTLHNFEDLNSFYEDMETPGGNLYIPDRAVDVVNRRPVSRNTHYRLTEQEATAIKNDPRVMNVELSLEERGLEFKPFWSQTSSFWNKSNFLNNAHRNWALLRCVEGSQRSNWGINGTASQTATIKTTSSGKHVDVVIVDGHIDPSHPEFSVNPDGTGGSRINQFNWLSLTSQVTGGANGNYVYTPYVDPSYPDLDNDGRSDRTDDNDHGAHVAGTAVGNTHGWARDANIYNISPYSTNPSFVSNFLDYVKVWHQQKPINPITGRRNPTITNHSYGLGRSIPINQITSVRFRGTIYPGPFDSNQLFNYGIYNDGTDAIIIEYSTAYETDITELINAGVIVVGSAGNNSTKIANFSLSSSDDYNNYLVRNSSTNFYYHQGTIAASSNSICVGSISALVNESKSTFSCCGPRVDIYAPGDYIISSVNSTLGFTVGDSRNSTYRITKYQGTSMASPQVTGVLACLLEQEPRLTQAQAREYLQSKSKIGQMTATSGGFADLTDLQGSGNRFLFYEKERSETGSLIPKNNKGLRPSSGMVYPRPKIYRYGS